MQSFTNNRKHQTVFWNREGLARTKPNVLRCFFAVRNPTEFINMSEVFLSVRIFSTQVTLDHFPASKANRDCTFKGFLSLRSLLEESKYSKMFTSNALSEVTHLYMPLFPSPFRDASEPALLESEQRSNCFLSQIRKKDFIPRLSVVFHDTKNKLCFCHIRVQSNSWRFTVDFNKWLQKKNFRRTCGPLLVLRVILSAAQSLSTLTLNTN